MFSFLFFEAAARATRLLHLLHLLRRNTLLHKKHLAGPLRRGVHTIGVCLLLIRNLVSGTVGICMVAPGWLTGWLAGSSAISCYVRSSLRTLTNAPGEASCIAAYGTARMEGVQWKCTSAAAAVDSQLPLSGASRQAAVARIEIELYTVARAVLVTAMNRCFRSWVLLVVGLVGFWLRLAAGSHHRPADKPPRTKFML